MKIGILTYHCVPNFGAQLQATSTVGYLKRMGYEPVVLHWYPRDLEDMYSKRISQEQVVCHNVYTKEMLPITNVCRTEVELICEINRQNLDAIIVGSDALFKFVPEKNRRYFSKKKLRYVSQNILSVERLEENPFFGAFVRKIDKNIPVVAFSVSSQNCPYEDMNEYEKSLMRESLTNYGSITVRDEWTKVMIESITGKSEIHITPDPVFSFNQNCYVRLLSKAEVLEKFHLQRKYMLISFGTKYNNEKYIKSLAYEVQKVGAQPVAFPMPEKLFSAGITNQVSLPLSPVDWYALIKYSSGYIGERMHPIVVCLHNVVPFFSFDEYGTYRKQKWGLVKKYIQESSKTYHILNKAGLTKWMHSYRLERKLPSPKEVIDKIEHFDVEKCKNFSEAYQGLYEMEMKRLVENFNK